MVDVFWYYVSTLVFVCVLGAFLCVYRYYLGNRLVEQSTKLKSQIAKIRQDYPEIGQKPSEYMAGALGDIGIEGIMDELGLGMFTPIAKGFLSNPENIKKLLPILEKAGIKIPDGNKSQTQETNVL